jgi:hypothetical protein
VLQSELGGTSKTTVAILPESEDTGRTTCGAIARNAQSTGRTAGEALDALTAQLSKEEAGTLIVVQLRRPWRFFTAQQQRREKLMARWRPVRDADHPMPLAEL